MEIIGTDMYEEKSKNKKTMIIIAIIIAILLVISIILFLTISYLKSKQFKYVVNDEKIKSYSSEMFIFEGEEIYVSLKDIASSIGYKHFNGGYGGYEQYTEDLDQCYLESENEITTFEKGSKKIYKTPSTSLDYTYYDISEAVKRINDKLYINSKDLGLACNLQFDFDNEKNQVSIYTVDYIAAWYTQKYTDAALTNFNNQKALLYGLMVVQSVDNTIEDKTEEKEIKYGIHNLNDKEIVGMKYADIEFIEGTQEFLVTTFDKKVGLITSEGNTRVTPQFDSLKQIDKDRNLYLASINNQYGIIEKNGKTLIYLEYEQIGVDLSDFKSNDIKNKYILFDAIIPVKRNNKWGFYNVDGNLVLPIEYDLLGCIIGSTTDKNVNSVLIIPEIESVVIGQYFIENEGSSSTKKVAKYGVYNAKGKEIVPICLDNLYSITSSGQVEYMMLNGGNTYNVIEYVKQWVIPQENTNTTPEQTETNNKTNETIVNNVVVNEVSTNSIVNEVSTNSVVNHTVVGY